VDQPEVRCCYIIKKGARGIVTTMNMRRGANRPSGKAKVFCCRGKANRDELGSNWLGTHVASSTSRWLDVFLIDNILAI
jgi:hypothetical protein